MGPQLKAGVIIIGIFAVIFFLVYALNTSVQRACIDAKKSWTTTSSITAEGSCK